MDRTSTDRLQLNQLAVWLECCLVNVVHCPPSPTSDWSAVLYERFVTFLDCRSEINSESSSLDLSTQSMMTSVSHPIWMNFEAANVVR
uniref:Uncharacterized protein n=1 Tax=Panagrellus redivivus TaxID=6233 RepID=A0A7E4UP34_PANRE